MVNSKEDTIRMEQKEPRKPPLNMKIADAEKRADEQQKPDQKSKPDEGRGGRVRTR